ncbi:hypothetical protein [Immundisolibacter sp.]|uniref:hypothetical protein n=1 Tax=Immundisolibacter sp. TaxID=1934948 RepID=UPI0035669556
MPLSPSSPPPPSPDEPGTDWIDDLTDEQCREVFWLYVDPPEEFLQRYPPSLLGQALRYALREVARQASGPQAT